MAADINKKIKKAGIKDLEKSLVLCKELADQSNRITMRNSKQGTGEPSDYVPCLGEFAVMVLKIIDHDAEADEHATLYKKLNLGSTFESKAGIKASWAVPSDGDPVSNLTKTALVNAAIRDLDKHLENERAGIQTVTDVQKANKLEKTLRIALSTLSEIPFKLHVSGNPTHFKLR